MCFFRNTDILKEIGGFLWKKKEVTENVWHEQLKTSYSYFYLAVNYNYAEGLTHEY